MRSLAGLGDSRAQKLAARPGGGLGGKGVLPATRKPGGPSSANRSGPGGRGLGKTAMGGKLKAQKRYNALSAIDLCILKLTSALELAKSQRIPF